MLDVAEVVVRSANTSAVQWLTKIQYEFFEKDYDRYLVSVDVCAGVQITFVW
jgi:hypothetical protein